jgi:hypothetical protein
MSVAGEHAERWRPVVGFEGLYEVSSFGHVRSLDHEVRTRNRRGAISATFRGRVLKPNTVGPYLSVTLSRGSVKVRSNVHVLVAEAFLGPRPEGMLACHADGTKRNCRADNLYYGTPKQNSEDAIRHGVQVRGERQAAAKLTDDDVRRIRLLAGKLTQRQIAKMFGVVQSTIGVIIRNQAWRHVQEEALAA